MDPSESALMGAGLVTLVAAVLLAVIPSVLGKRPVPQHDSILTGKLYYNELMDTLNVSRFRTAVRMDRHTFTRLHALLTSAKGGLQDSALICAGEKIMILIHVLVGFTNRQTCERWQHSGSTISLVTHEVVKSIMRCKTLLFRRPRPPHLLAPYISNSPKFFPFFRNAMGALDGSHIHAIIKAADQGVFRNRKKTISQNLLGVCNFDMTFSYALAGWEGSAHDGQVLADARTKGLPLFDGWYYLADAGYALTRSTLTPYRGVRYHLREWQRQENRPQNKEELFNLAVGRGCRGSGTGLTFLTTFFAAGDSRERFAATGLAGGVGKDNDENCLCDVIGVDDDELPPCSTTVYSASSSEWSS